MSQQHMDFDEINRDESASYATGFEETPHYNAYPSGSSVKSFQGKISAGHQRRVNVWHWRLYHLYCSY